MNKADFKKKAKKSIDDIFANIDELETKKHKVEENVKAEHEKILNNLKTKRKELQAKYDSLVDVSDEKWEEAKSTFSSAKDSFKEGFSKIADLI